jgi:hypothetical protein
LYITYTGINTGKINVLIIKNTSYKICLTERVLVPNTSTSLQTLAAEAHLAVQLLLEEQT